MVARTLDIGQICVHKHKQLHIRTDAVLQSALVQAYKGVEAVLKLTSP